MELLEDQCCVMMPTHPLICLVNPLIELVCFAFLIGVPDARCTFNALCCAGVDLSQHVYETFVQWFADDCNQPSKNLLQGELGQKGLSYSNAGQAYMNGQPALLPLEQKPQRL